MKRYVYALLAMLSMGVAVQAQVKSDQVKLMEVRQKLDGIFSPVFKPNQPGAAVLILKDGKKVFEQCYGVADMETMAPVTPKTRFCIASVSKQFSAVAILQLVEKGLVKLSDPLSKFFPE